MSDQMKWLKVWTSIAIDPGLRRLPKDLRWAWLGAACYVAIEGKKGTITVPQDALEGLAFFMDVPPDSAVTILKKLPNVTLKSVTANVTVTFDNWSRFQEDKTAAERMRRYRLEEKRRESSKSPTATASFQGPPPEPPCTPESHPPGSQLRKYHYHCAKYSGPPVESPAHNRDCKCEPCYIKYPGVRAS